MSSADRLQHTVSSYNNWWSREIDQVVYRTIPFFPKAFSYRSSQLLFITVGWCPCSLVKDVSDCGSAIHVKRELSVHSRGCHHCAKSLGLHYPRVLTSLGAPTLLRAPIILRDPTALTTLPSMKFLMMFGFRTVSTHAGHSQVYHEAFCRTLHWPQGMSHPFKMSRKDVLND